MANSPDIWNAVNGLNQQGYEAAPAHQTQSGGYGSMEVAHAHMVRLPSLLPLRPSWGHQRSKLLVRLGLQDSYSPHSVLAADVSRGLPPMSTFHRNNVALRTSENSTSEKDKHFISFLAVLYQRLHVARCVCLISVSGNHRNASGGSQTGDTLGKALASVSAAPL